jgi:hypothetical protein
VPCDRATWRSASSSRSRGSSCAGRRRVHRPRPIKDAAEDRGQVNSPASTGRARRSQNQGGFARYRFSVWRHVQWSTGDAQSVRWISVPSDEQRRQSAAKPIADRGRAVSAVRMIDVRAQSMLPTDVPFRRGICGPRDPWLLSRPACSRASDCPALFILTIVVSVREVVVCHRSRTP